MQGFVPSQCSSYEHSYFRQSYILWVTVAEIHAILHSLLSPGHVESPPTFSHAPHRVPTDFPADTIHLSQPRNYFPSTSSDEEGWTQDTGFV
ncbi:hypothetical protein Pmani_010307 [Petrolisthes manimaculis]|uniref:Uncharacterized protein n=1 Tax=Petrolisthes manimaculis TaxID=1843537 RepID=A0AAE1UHF0_9EUCA|nr:hypothetical protein Pmani_010307 [Petrolisthes manimaculis]